MNNFVTAFYTVIFVVALVYLFWPIKIEPGWEEQTIQQNGEQTDG